MRLEHGSLTSLRQHALEHFDGLFLLLVRSAESLSQVQHTLCNAIIPLDYVFIPHLHRIGGEVGASFSQTKRGDAFRAKQRRLTSKDDEISSRTNYTAASALDGIQTGRDESLCFFLK